MVSKKIIMKKTLYILTLLLLIGCGDSKYQKNNLDESEVVLKDTIENTNNLIWNTQIESAGDTLNWDSHIEKEDDILLSYIQTDSIVEESSYNLEEYRRESLNLSFEKSTLFNLTDTITADFNGDGIIDKAVYVKEIETSGIIIIHGKLNEEVRIGFGEHFAHMTEFDWVDYWGLVIDKETSQVTFTEDGDILGSEDVRLQNPSIALGENEAGGGLITYLNGKYVWIHQTC